MLVHYLVRCPTRDEVAQPAFEEFARLRIVKVFAGVVQDAAALDVVGVLAPFVIVAAAGELAVVLQADFDGTTESGSSYGIGLGFGIGNLTPFLMPLNLNIKFIHESKMDVYLRVLSLYQTCEYLGASFLQFMLSGEEDLDKLGLPPIRWVDMNS